MTISPSRLKPQTSSQNKISPAKALHKLITENRSGRLTVTHPNDSSVQWRVYFGEGQVHFAESLQGRSARLPYVLREIVPHLSLHEADFSSDYDWVCEYWRIQQLPMNLVRKILTILTQEALIQLLAIPLAHVEYENSIGLDQLLLSVPFRQLILPKRDRITQWAQLSPVLASPLQRPVILQQEHCLQMVWSDGTRCQYLQEMTSWAEEYLTLYEIATRLSIDVLELAQMLQPLLEEEAIALDPFQVIEKPKRPLVVCVDDSPTIQQFVKLSLESSGYDVLSLMDPTQAVVKLLDHRPILILMDIEMPKMDGYELCRSTRQIEALSETPIVMLTGREGLIDRVRARMAGCTAYLTKPFNPDELLETVHKLAQTPQPIPQI